MAENHEVITILEALASHCRAPIMSVETRARWMRDWCDDLRAYPLEKLEAAVTDWRRSGETKFPSPGQLLAKLRTPERLVGPAAEPQRPLSDDEYRAASLSEKLRYHRFMANAASLQAAVLWRRLPETRAGNPPSYMNWQASLPAHWAEQREIESHHYRMAAEIKQRLKRSGDAA